METDTMIQSDMFPALKAPDDGDARAIWYYLHGRGYVHTRQIAYALGFGAGDTGRRRITEAVRCARGLLISGPGSPGIARCDEVEESEAMHWPNARRHACEVGLKLATAQIQMIKAHARKAAEFPKEAK